MDSLQTEIMNQAFIMGFDYGKTWFLLFLVVILGVLIYRIVSRL